MRNNEKVNTSCTWVFSHRVLQRRLGGWIRHKHVKKYREPLALSSRRCRGTNCVSSNTPLSFVNQISHCWVQPCFLPTIPIPIPSRKQKAATLSYRRALRSTRHTTPTWYTGVQRDQAVTPNPTSTVWAKHAVQQEHPPCCNTTEAFLPTAFKVADRRLRCR